MCRTSLCLLILAHIDDAQHNRSDSLHKCFHKSPTLPLAFNPGISMALKGAASDGKTRNKSFSDTIPINLPPSSTTGMRLMCSFIINSNASWIGRAAEQRTGLCVMRSWMNMGIDRLVRELGDLDFIVLVGGGRVNYFQIERLDPLELDFLR
jgi:hypothetical protein